MEKHLTVLLGDSGEDITVVKCVVDTDSPEYIELSRLLNRIYDNEGR